MQWLAPYVGLLNLANDLNTGILDDTEVGIFTTAHPPTLADNMATYTGIEGSWTGYARQQANPWTTPAIDASNRAVQYSQLLVFPVTALPGVTVAYGYFVKTISGAQPLLWAEQFDAPITLIAGVPLSMIARFFLKNL